MRSVRSVRPVPILIAGGGIGGLATALALAKRGRAVTVIEKAPEFGELGAGLQLAPNASRMLDRLGVLDRIAASAVFPNRIVWMDALSGDQLTSLDLGPAFVARFDYRYIVMHRSDLLTTLLEACRAQPNITLETSKDVSAVEDAGDAAIVRFADETVYRAEILIGADGLWSTIRKSIVDDGDPICAQYVAYRGAIPIDQISARAGLDSVVLWTGPRMHLVQYPVRRGELYNQVAVFKSSRYTPDSDDWGTPDELDEHYANTAEPVREALADIKRNRRWPMYDRLPIGTWSRNRITLIGDAAHPMLQYIAQGASQALEDAVALGDAIADHDDVADAFAAYERLRVARTARVQRTARAFGEYKHVEVGPDYDARKAFLGARDFDDYRAIDWLYGEGRAVPVGAPRS